MKIMEQDVTLKGSISTVCMLFVKSVSVLVQKVWIRLYFFFHSHRQVHLNPDIRKRVFAV